MSSMAAFGLDEGTDPMWYNYKLSNFPKPKPETTALRKQVFSGESLDAADRKLLGSGGFSETSDMKSMDFQIMDHLLNLSLKLPDGVFFYNFSLPAVKKKACCCATKIMPIETDTILLGKSLREVGLDFNNYFEMVTNSFLKVFEESIAPTDKQPFLAKKGMAGMYILFEFMKKYLFVNFERFGDDILRHCSVPHVEFFGIAQRIANQLEHVQILNHFSAEKFLVMNPSEITFDYIYFNSVTKNPVRLEFNRALSLILSKGMEARDIALNLLTDYLNLMTPETSPLKLRPEKLKELGEVSFPPRSASEMNMYISILDQIFRGLSQVEVSLGGQREEVSIFVAVHKYMSKMLMSNIGPKTFDNDRYSIEYVMLEAELFSRILSGTHLIVDNPFLGEIRRRINERRMLTAAGDTEDQEGFEQALTPEEVEEKLRAYSGASGTAYDPASSAKSNVKSRDTGGHATQGGHHYKTGGSGSCGKKTGGGSCAKSKRMGYVAQ